MTTPNGLLIVDKDAGMTSHDVVGCVRRLFSLRRVGHGGTLDPMATGVLPIFLGRATRATEYASASDKEYLATLQCGIVTDTQDTTGTVLSKSDVSVSSEQIIALLPRFIGPQLQTPPMYSAVRYQGKKLYELARSGTVVQRAARPITIHRLELIDARPQERRFTLRVVCSKGTYVRTLIHDLGAALGSGAAMSALRRVRTGQFTLKQAVSLDTLRGASNSQRLNFLLPVDRLFSQFPSLTLNDSDERRCRNGAVISLRHLIQAPEDGLYRVYGTSGEFLMLGSISHALLKTEKSFFEPESSKE